MNRWWVLVGLFAIILGSYFYSGKSIPGSLDSTNLIAKSEPTQKHPERALKSHKLKMALIESTKRKNLLPEAPNSQCLEFWNALENHPFHLSELGERSVKLPLPPVCKNIPEEIRKVHSQYEKECFQYAGIERSKLPKEKQNDFETCVFNLLIYRSTLHDYVTKDLDIMTTTDMSLLLEKLMASINQFDARRIELISQRMHDLEPDFYEPLKALVISKLVASLSETDERAKTELILALERSLQDAKDFGIFDPELLQAEVFIRSNGFQDLNAVEREGLRISAEYPDKGWGEYAIAGAKFHQKDFQATKAHLMAALQREPNHKDFQKTLAELEKDPQNFDRKIFTISLGLKLNFNDQNNPIIQQKRP